jgi:spore germination protein GerM
MRPYLQKTHHKKRAGRMAQGVGPEFKSQHCQKQTNKQTENNSAVHVQVNDKQNMAYPHNGTPPATDRKKVHAHATNRVSLKSMTLSERSQEKKVHIA